MTRLDHLTFKQAQLFWEANPHPDLTPLTREEWAERGAQGYCAIRCRRIVAVGYVSTDGYIGGLRSISPGAGKWLLLALRDRAGDAAHLDCYGDGLARLYAGLGFKETFRADFNADLAPEGYDGTPDYIEMKVSA